MPKYYYKPILKNVKETYIENATKEYEPGFDIESNVRLIIEAENQEASDIARMGFIDIRMWELDKVD
jgi:hypothetical protein